MNLIESVAGVNACAICVTVDDDGRVKIHRLSPDVQVYGRCDFASVDEAKILARLLHAAINGEQT